MEGDDDGEEVGVDTTESEEEIDNEDPVTEAE
jgi:hypothetical protein